MNRIRLLPEAVANQIAAGEVIERPASVVKELVENALDAGATRLVIEIRRGGRQLVRVADDGHGMSRDDALMCLERHATSKIRSAHDLAAIRSMGFRGEALPSIASVSRFTLTTRERDGTEPDATQIVMDAGRILDVRAAGHPPGTTVEVAQLFHNLPARRKFLRSEETERAHIQHYLTLAALAYPETGFTLRQEERLLWQLPPMPEGQDLANGVRDRLRTLLGAEVSLLRVDTTLPLPVRSLSGGVEEAEPDEAGSVRLWGFLGAPGVSRATRQDQHLFVNRRPVDNRGLNFALLEGYHTALMKGRYPVACLFLEIDPAEVDINVHPAKREVRFHHESAVRGAVAAAVRQALVDYHQSSPTAANPRPSAVAATPPPVTDAPAAHPVQTRPPTGPASGELVPESVNPSWLPHLHPEPVDGFQPPPAPPEAATPQALTVPGAPVVSASPSPATAAAPVASPSPSTPTSGPRPLLRVPLRLIGVVGRLYVLLESDRGLVLMDQHAAHERVLFEQMMRRLEHGPAPSQRLLLPETVELSVRDALFVREHLELLTRLGVGLGEFGERTFLLEAIPPIVRSAAGRQFVRELIDALVAAGRDVNKLRLGEDVVAKTVCRHAVKANDPLSTPELEKLVENLRACEMPYTCPHGRPTLIEISTAELERKFGRVQ